MARKTVFVSDLTGQEIEDGRGAQIIVKYHDARRGEVTLDVTDEEASELASKGVKRQRRGRKPAATST